MIKNFDSLTNKVWSILENDGVIAIKINFSNENDLNSFINNYCKQYLNPSLYNYSARHKNSIVITLADDYGVHDSYCFVTDTLSAAAYDYKAKKIQII